MKNKFFSSRYTALTPMRFFAVVLLLAFALSFLAPAALADWNGNSDITGGGGIEVSGDYSLAYADINDMYGYRFTVLDANGNKPADSRSVDIMFKDDPAAANRTTGIYKRSHVELNQQYETYDTVSLGSFYKTAFSASSTVSTSARDYGLYYYSNYYSADLEMFKDPSQMGTWLTEKRAREIATHCQYFDYSDLNSNFIIVEPLYAATLVDPETGSSAVYMMTLAEFGVYQAAQYDWWYDRIPEYSTQGNYTVLMRHLSALYGMHLYADKEFAVLGTAPIESVHIRDLTSFGAPGNHIIIEPDKSVWANGAENILKYQMGMGIYTNMPADNATLYTVTYDANGGTGAPAPQKFVYCSGDPISSQVPTRAGYKFLYWMSQWREEPFYPGDPIPNGWGDFTLVAQWEAVPEATYTVRHWQQMIGSQPTAYNSTNYTQYGPDEQYTGNVGGSILLSKHRKVFEGFSYAAGCTGTSASTTIQIAFLRISRLPLLAFSCIIPKYNAFCYHEYAQG